MNFLFYFFTANTQSVVCPAVRTTSGWLDLFPLPCTKRADCSLMGARHLCCKGFCTKGVKAPRSVLLVLFYTLSFAFITYFVFIYKALYLAIKYLAFLLETLFIHKIMMHAPALLYQTLVIK